MTLNEEIRLKLRIKSTAFDEGEITPLVQACKADMKRAGVPVVDEEHPLTREAIKLYCQAFFGSNNPDTDKYRKCYESIRDGLALVGDDYFEA